MTKTRYAFLILLAGAALLQAGGPAFEAGGRPALVNGDFAPGIQGMTLDGRVFEVDYNDSRFTFVNFWASWCAPCVQEMPALQKIYESTSREDLRILGVTHPRDSREDLTKFAETAGVTYTIVVPVGGTSRKWGDIRALPTSFIVNDEGKIVRRYFGATPEQIEIMTDDIHALIDGRPMESRPATDRPEVTFYEDRPEG